MTRDQMQLVKAVARAWWRVWRLQVAALRRGS